MNEQDSALLRLIKFVPPTKQADALLKALEGISADREEPIPQRVQTIHIFAETLSHFEEGHDWNSQQLQTCQCYVIRFAVDILISSQDLETATNLSLALQANPFLAELFLISICAEVDRQAGQITTNKNYTSNALLSVGSIFSKGTLRNNQVELLVSESLGLRSGLTYLQAHSLNTNTLPSWQNDILLPLIVLTASSGEEDSRAAARVIFAICSPKSNREITARNLPNLSNALLLTREALIQRASQAWRCTLGLNIWLKFLTVQSGATEPGQSATDSLVIRNILSYGTGEQQKTALAIFRLSVLHQYSQQGVKPQIVSQYSKYVNVYEAVVLGGYLNQAEECLDDLKSLFQADSAVGKEWVLALLIAIFRDHVQASIRTLVVRWLLSEGKQLVAAKICTEPAFLTTALLPWAMTGNLFVSSIEKMLDFTVYCRHGDQLSKVIEDVVIHSIAYQDGESGIASSILQYVVQQDRKVNAFARAYVVEGTVNGITKSGRPSVKDVKLLSEVAQANGSFACAQDYVSALANEVLQRGTLDSELRV